MVAAKIYIYIDKGHYFIIPRSGSLLMALIFCCLKKTVAFVSFLRSSIPI